MTNYQVIIEHILGNFGFTLAWEYLTGVSAKVKVYSIVAREGDLSGPPQYYIKDWEDSGDQTGVLDEAQVLAEVYIKFDGCTHVNFEKNLHLCGGASYVEHILLMKHIYEKASVLIERPLDMPDLGIEIMKGDQCLKT